MAVFHLSFVACQLDCGSNYFQNEIAATQLNSNSFLDADSKENLDQRCETSRSFLRKADTYLSECIGNQETLREAVNNLIMGFRKTTKKLCDDSKYRSRFLSHAKCLHNNHGATKKCEEYLKDFQLQEGNFKYTKQRFCSVREEAYSCIESRTETACGTDAADLIMDLMLTIEGEIPKSLCSDYSASYHSDTSSSSHNVSTWTTIAMSLFLILYKI